MLSSKPSEAPRADCHFLAESGIVLMTSQWRSSTAIIAVEPGKRLVTRVTPEDSSWALLSITAGGGLSYATQGCEG